MALIACPNPSCAHEVVDNWPSCPKCHCPIQVLLSARAAKAQEEHAAADAEARLEEEKPSGKMLERLQKAARDDEPIAVADDQPDESRPRSPRSDLVHRAGKAMLGLGGVAALGVPATLHDPGLATFLGLTAGVCFAAGLGLQQVADTMTQAR